MSHYHSTVCVHTPDQPCSFLFGWSSGKFQELFFLKTFQFPTQSNKKFSKNGKTSLLFQVSFSAYIDSIFCRLTVQTESQVGTIPVRIEKPDSYIISVREGSPVEIPCLGVGLPSPQFRYRQVFFSQKYSPR